VVAGLRERLADAFTLFQPLTRRLSMPNKSSNGNNNARQQATLAGDAGQQDNTTLNPKASGHGGKVENDFNQVGDQKPTQRNEGQRTANSRSDRESHVGGSNQLQSRRGNGGNSGH
jgi:hypothetical protein